MLHPEAFTMRVGERRLAVSRGINITSVKESRMFITTTNTNVIKLEYPDVYTAYIVAIRPGTATVKLRGVIDKAAGRRAHHAVIRDPTFEVHVLPNTSQ